MWCVYILYCDKKRYYVGLTSNIINRLYQHKKGFSKYTKRFNEIELIYYEKYSDYRRALRRERQIKGWTKAKKIALINGESHLLRRLSRSSIN